MRPGKVAKSFLMKAFEEANRYRRIGYYALAQGKIEGITCQRGQDFRAYARMVNYLKFCGGNREYLTSRSLLILVPQILKRYQWGIPFSGNEKAFSFLPSVKTFKEVNRIWLPKYQKYVKLLPLKTDDVTYSIFLENKDLFKTVSIIQNRDNEFRVRIRISQGENDDNEE